METPTPLRVVIAGSRSLTHPSLVERAITATGLVPTEIVSGGAEGIDTLAREYADARKIPFREFRPQYDRYPGKVAPLKRNEVMAEYGDVLIALWDGSSTGTAHMVRQIESRNKPVHLFKVTV